MEEDDATLEVEASHGLGRGGSDDMYVGVALP